jgi:hypothetical protein
VHNKFKKKVIQTNLKKGLLMESKKAQGEMKITGNISYCSQKSWIKSDTIINNILFGKEFDKEKYQKILKVCQLERDLVEIGGEDTEVIIYFKKKDWREWSNNIRWSKTKN